MYIFKGLPIYDTDKFLQIQPGIQESAFLRFRDLPCFWADGIRISRKQQERTSPEEY